MENLSELFHIIQTSDVITIWGHAEPDGDCYGCQIGLRELLKHNFPEKKVYAIGTGIPSLFGRLAPMDIVDEATIASSLAILVDVSCLRRVEDQRVRLASSFMKFDHHCLSPELEAFPYPHYVDEDCIAAAQILVEFALLNHLEIPRISAECFYLGAATDSGNFTYYGTTDRTRELMSYLLSLGAEMKSIMEIVYHEDDEVKAFKEFLRAHAVLDGTVSYVVAKKEDYLSIGLPYVRAAKMVNAIAHVYDAPIHALFIEMENGDWTGELRSNKQYPVQPIAKKYGGGGHMFASGLTLSKDSGYTYLDVVSDLKKVRI